MGEAARKLCRQLGIRIIPGTPWREMQTKNVNVIDLIAQHGLDNMALTLRILTETNPANRSQLNHRSQLGLPVASLH
jgi:hypothetical protein